MVITRIKLGATAVAVALAGYLPVVAQTPTPQAGQTEQPAADAAITPPPPPTDQAGASAPTQQQSQQQDASARANRGAAERAPAQPPAAGPQSGAPPGGTAPPASAQRPAAPAQQPQSQGPAARRDAAAISERAVAGQAWAVQQGVITFNNQALPTLSSEEIRSLAVQLSRQSDQFARQLAALEGNEAAPGAQSESARSEGAPSEGTPGPEHRVARVDVDDEDEAETGLIFDRGLEADPGVQLDAVDPSLQDPQRALLDVPDPLDYDADPNDIADRTTPAPSRFIEGQQDGPAEAIQPIRSNTPEGAEVGTDTTDAPIVEAGESPYTQSPEGIVDAPGGDRPTATTYREAQTQSDTLPVNEATEQAAALEELEEREAELEQAAALEDYVPLLGLSGDGRAARAQQAWIELKRDVVRRLTAAQLEQLQRYPAENREQVYLGIVAANQMAVAAEAAAMAETVDDAELRALLQQISAFARQQQQTAENLMALTRQQ